MKKTVILLFLTLFTVIPVHAMDITAPTAPDTIAQYIPEEDESFSEGLYLIIKDAIYAAAPDLKEAVPVCIGVIAASITSSYAHIMSKRASQLINLVITLVISGLLLRSTNSMIRLGIQTVTQLIEYGKLLLPVMTAALAAQGASTTSASLFAITSAFLNLMAVISTRIMIPLLSALIAIFIGATVISGSFLHDLQKLIKWMMTWTLKLSTYIFTGFLGITRAINGTVDASAIKATKLALSGIIPVVGNVISDASESVLLSAGILKNSAGVYGMLVIISMLILPFFKIGVHYILLKLTAGICKIFASKEVVTLIQNFTSAMGYALALLATVSILLLLSTVCFMKGIS